MRVVDLLNVLQRFDGETEVSLSGDLTVGGVPVVESGKQTFTPKKGTKGAGIASGARQTARATRSRSRSPEATE